MAADADARLVDVAVRLRVGGSDDLRDVQAPARRIPRQLVGVGDVHVAVRRLRQLRHLRRLGIGDGPDLGPLVEDGPIEVDRATRALVARPADDLRVALEVTEDATDEDPLRAEGEEEVPIELEAAPAASIGPNRSRVVPTGSVVSYTTASAPTLAARSRVAASIGPKSISRRSSTTTGTITTTASAARRRMAPPTSWRAASPRRHELRDAIDERLLVGVRRLATVEGVDDALVDVDAEDVVATGGVLHGQWQADVAEPDDRDPHASASSSARPAITSPVSADSTILRASSSATIASCGSTGGGPPSRTARANSRSSTRSGSSRLTRTSSRPR